MMSVAAGLATCGKTVFASSFAMFAAGRAFEQIRNSIGYPRLNVKIGATHAGISVGEDGATHQCLEDIGIMRTIPGMVIINPADGNEAILAVKAAIEHDGPVYLRFGRLAVPVIFDENYEFEIGKGVMLKDGKDVSIIATGLMVSEALKAYDELKEKDIGAPMGVSRTPVREALRQLELEGLVHIIPNKGAFVEGVTLKDIKDIYEMRTLLEGLCARWAAGNITKEQLDELEETMFLSDFHFFLSYVGKCEIIKNLTKMFEYLLQNI